MLKNKMICGTCGGENVRRDADAVWDVESQEWVLNAVYDNATCEDCETDVSISEVPVEME